MASMQGISSTVYRPINTYPTASRRFHWTAALLSLWFISGLYLDGWAHINLPSTLETFFTPWHGVLYSGFLVAFSFLSFHQVRDMGQGYTLRFALPRGYWLSLIGMGLFAFGGGFDLLWHELFGIEQNIEALISPSHLLLATGGFLYAAGIFAALWQRSTQHQAGRWLEVGPVILAMFCTICLLNFFLQDAHFFGNPRYFLSPPPTEFRMQELVGIYGIASTLMPTLLLLGMLFLLMRRWRLPFGILTVLWSIPAVMMIGQHYKLLPTFALSLGLIIIYTLGADILLYRGGSLLKNPRMLRWFSFGFPFCFFCMFFVSVKLTHQVTFPWSIHMWLGLSFMAGIAGLLLSFIAVPPQLLETDN